LNVYMVDEGWAAVCVGACAARGWVCRFWWRVWRPVAVQDDAQVYQGPRTADAYETLKYRR
jgi:hypothetical protein